MGFFLFALTLVVWQALNPDVAVTDRSLSNKSVSNSARNLIIFVGLPLSVIAQNALAIYCAEKLTPLPPFIHNFPLHLLGRTGTSIGISRAPESAALFAIVLAQTFMLRRLIGQHKTPIRGPQIAVGASTLALISIFSPVLTSSDIYFYVGSGHLGFATYNLSHSPFSGDLEPLNRHFIIDGTTYGPAWVAINSALVRFGQSFLQSILVLKFTNAFLIVGCYTLLARCSVSPGTRLVFLLNPYMWYYFVATPHNDMFAIAALIAAISLCEAAPQYAVLLVAVAGLIKLPFLLFGSAVFSKLNSFPKRSLAMGSAAVLCLSVSWFTGGHEYLRSLTRFGKTRPPESEPIIVLTSLSALLLFSTMLIIRRRWISSGALLAPSASPMTLPWYAIWALPYTVSENRCLGWLLIFYPMIGFALDDYYDSIPYVVIALALALFVALCQASVKFRTWRQGGARKSV